MNLLLLLHFYQPYNQQKDILDKVANESYLPITRGLIDNPMGRVTVNISASLTKLLVENGYQEVIDNLRRLAANDQIEFTSTAAYHAFLPLLPESEIKRQINLNNSINAFYFGDVFKPQGFFPPEMAIDPKVFEIAYEMGYKWVACPEMAVSDSTNNDDSFFRIQRENNYKLDFLLRNKRVSNLILSGLVKNSEELLNETQDIAAKKFIMAVMDAETFGHHRIGHEALLFDLLQNKKIHTFTVTAMQGMSSSSVKNVEITRSCTWTNEEQDFWLDKEKTTPTDTNSFILWNDPSNPIHQLQWELTSFVIKSLDVISDKSSDKYAKARDLLDKSLSSDQYWWASAKPWWSLEMIESGAFELRNVIKLAYGEGSNEYTQANEFYTKIMDKAFEWQRTGYVRKNHLDASSTFMAKPFKERAPWEWYNQLILEFEDEMNKSAKSQNFEKAIKWRDALYKLKSGNDIYDVLHVVNDLWTARNIPSIKPFFEHDWSEFSDFAKKYFERIKNEKDFKALKTEKDKSKS